MDYLQKYAKVVSNKKLSSTMWEAVIRSSEIASLSKPGQFLNIVPSKNWNDVMRRPMSIAGIDNDKIKLLYKIIGNGTSEMSKWQAGNEVDIIGPLGNNFGNYENFLPVLIGGGTGTAPLLFLRDIINQKKLPSKLIIGARSKEEHFIEHNPDNNIYISTDDGSYGIKGNVLSALKEIHLDNKNKKIKIFACGPNMMMKSIQEFSTQHDLLCELSLECIMACGIGLCQGCTIEVDNLNESKTNSYREKFQLLCIDGPVMKSNEVILAEE